MSVFPCKCNCCAGNKLLDIPLKGIVSFTNPWIANIQMEKRKLEIEHKKLQSQLEVANKVIEVLEDMNKFTLETLNEENINLHMMRQVEQGARQALAEVEKIRNGGEV